LLQDQPGNPVDKGLCLDKSALDRLSKAVPPDWAFTVFALLVATAVFVWAGDDLISRLKPHTNFEAAKKEPHDFSRGQPFRVYKLWCD